MDERYCFPFMKFEQTWNAFLHLSELMLFVCTNLQLECSPGKIVEWEG